MNNASNSSQVSNLAFICDRFDFPECHLAANLQLIVSPIFLILGTFGNILSLLVFSRNSIRKTSCIIYFMVLAVADLVYLYTGLLKVWLFYLTGLEFGKENSTTCGLQLWVRYSAFGYTCLLQVVITLDRLLAIKCPLTARKVCTPNLAGIVAGSLFAFVAILNSHILFGMERVETYISNSSDLHVVRCRPSPRYAGFYNKLWQYMSVSLYMYMVIPFCCVLVGNSAIALALAQRRRQRLRPAHPEGAGTGRAAAYTTQESAATRSVTTMLMAVSAYFLVATLPICCYVILLPLKLLNETPEQVAKRRLFWTASNLLAYSNSVANCFLYFVSGPVFRNTLIDMLKDFGARARRCIPLRRNRRVVPAPIEDTPAQLSDGQCLPGSSTVKCVIKPGTSGMVVSIGTGSE